MGFAEYRPSTSTSNDCNLPVLWSEDLRPFGLKLPRFRLVPLLSFLPTSAVYSSHHPVGLLHPTAGHGVRPVSGSLIRSLPKE